MLQFCHNNLSTPSFPLTFSFALSSVMGDLEPQGSYYAAEFTSTVNDTCDVCGGKALLKYMHHKNRQKTGHHLCPSCYDRYLNKAGTVHQSGGRSTQHLVTATEWQVIINRLPMHKEGVCVLCHSLIHKVIIYMALSGISNSVWAIGVNGTSCAGHLATGHITNTSSGPIHMPGPAVHPPGHVLVKNGGFLTLLQQGK